MCIRDRSRPVYSNHSKVTLSPAQAGTAASAAHNRMAFKDSSLTSTVHGRRGRSQYELVEGEVQPAAELESRVTYDAAGVESEALVQPDADGVGGVYAAHHHVIV